MKGAYRKGQTVEFTTARGYTMRVRLTIDSLASVSSSGRQYETVFGYRVRKDGVSFGEDHAHSVPADRITLIG